MAFSGSASAQLYLGDQLTRPNGGKLKDTDIQALTKATTYFVIRPLEEELKEEYQAVFDDIWTFNTMKVVTLEEYFELRKEQREGNSFMLIDGYTTVTQGRTISYSNPHYFHHLYVLGEEIGYSNKELKKMEQSGTPVVPNYEVRTIARAELFPSSELLMMNDGIGLSDQEKAEQLAFMYNGAKFYNLHLGFLKNTLQEIQRFLKEGKERSLFEYSTNEKELGKLKRQTLYFPDHMLIEYNKFNGDESGRHDPEELLKNYEHPHKIISAEELSEMILFAKEPFYYFNYVRSSTDAFYTVTNGLTGEILFSMYDAVTYNMKPKNLKHLNNLASSGK